MEIKHLNNKLYTELPIDELDERLSMEELQDKLEMKCWTKCSSFCAEDIQYSCDGGIYFFPGGQDVG